MSIAADADSARIVLDRDGCIGSGMCVSTASDVFDLDDEGKVVLVAGDLVAGAQLASARDAVALCPAHVISLVEPN